MSAALHRYGNFLTHRLLLASFMASFLPLPKLFYLGNAGEPLFAVIAPLILTLSSGLVIAVWWVLCILLCLTRRASGIVFRRYGNVDFARQSLMSRYDRRARRTELNSVTRNTLISIAILFLVIFLFVPWQVAFLGCWVLQLHNTAVSRPQPSEESSAADGRLSRSSLEEKIEGVSNARQNNANLNEHILLLMTWLLPLVAPILAVWVRTLATAGFTTPFNGDHNFAMVAPFLVLVDFASWTTGGIFAKAR